MTKTLYLGNRISTYDGIDILYYDEFKFKHDEFDIVYICKDNVANDLSRFMVLKDDGLMILEEGEKTDDFLLCCRNYYIFLGYNNGLFFIRKKSYN